MLIDDPRPIICPICTQRTVVKSGRVVPHISGILRGYCRGTGFAIEPHLLGELAPKEVWKDPDESDDDTDTEDP